MSTTDHNCVVSPEPTDEQLMAAFQGGDKAAFAAIYHRHRPSITGYFVKRLHGALLGDVEDLVQTTFTKLAVASKKYAVAQSRNYVTTLLYRIANSLVHDHLRRRLAEMRDCRREETPVHAKMIDTERETRETARRDVYELLDCLPPFEAKAVRMKDLEGYTGKAASEALGIKQTTFEWYYLKAHKRLEALAAEDVAAVSRMTS